MSNFIEDARTDLKGLLTGYTVHEYRPEKVSAPCIVIEPQDQYLVPGQTRGEWRVSMTLTCLIATSTNKTATQRMDETISNVIETLRGEWTVTGVSTGIITVNEYDHLAALISINTNIHK